MSKYKDRYPSALYDWTVSCERWSTCLDTHSQTHTCQLVFTHTQTVTHKPAHASKLLTGSKNVELIGCDRSKIHNIHSQCQSEPGKVTGVKKHQQHLDTHKQMNSKARQKQSLLFFLRFYSLNVPVFRQHCTGTLSLAHSSANLCDGGREIQKRRRRAVKQALLLLSHMGIHESQADTEMRGAGYQFSHKHRLEL